MEAQRQGPLTVECTRGPAVESRHLVDAAAVDAAGRLVGSVRSPREESEAP